MGVLPATPANRDAGAAEDAVMRLHRLLGDHRRYLAQIDRLHLKYAKRAYLYDLKQDGVSLASISLQRTKVARLLADAVAADEYGLRPAQNRWITVNGKKRLIYEFCLTDLIVHGVVASILEERIRPHLSPQLYSYRKGLPWWWALRDFARYVRVHRRMRADPKQRGLYVLRRDICSYTDSIPVDERSRIWPQLKGALGLGRSRRPRDASGWSLIRNVVRPETISEAGGRYQNLRGTPTGSPICPVLFNLYLGDMDKELTAVPNSFYARYCDDFLFAHPDPGLTRSVARRIDEILTAYGLCTNEEKDRDLFFTGAGRPSTDWPESRATTTVPFLGCEIAFDASVSLDRKKVRRLLKGIADRARRTMQAVDDPSPDEAGRTVCGAINRALEPTSELRLSSALLLRQVVTSRSQLKDLDYRIARVVVQRLTGNPSIRAFRRVPYRRLRSDWHLLSLFHSRNLSSRRPRAVSCGP
jgi:hypothetical protein